MAHEEGSETKRIKYNMDHGLWHMDHRLWIMDYGITDLIL
jgi:hypothetical protein